MPPADPWRLRAAICAALGVMLASPPALAQWRDRPRDQREGARGGMMQERAPRAAPAWGSRDGGRGYGGPRSFQAQGYQAQAYRGQAYRGEGARGPELRGQELRGPELRGQPFRGGPGPYAGYGAGRPSGGEARAWRRGQVLPDGYRGATVPDPGRYHLRRAPNGYDWVGDDRNAYLMQRSTGMVLDSVPGAYEAPPPYPGRRRR